MTNQQKKHERFLRVTETRVIAVTEGLRKLGTCSDRKNYEYTKQEASEIINTLREAVKDLETRFFVIGLGKGK